MLAAFLAGAADKLVMGCNVWYDSSMPLNLYGQICLPFTLAWCGLSALALGSMRMLRS